MVSAFSGPAIKIVLALLNPYEFNEVEVLWVALTAEVGSVSISSVPPATVVRLVSPARN